LGTTLGKNANTVIKKHVYHRQYFPIQEAAS